MQKLYNKKQKIKTTLFFLAIFTLSFIFVYVDSIMHISLKNLVDLLNLKYSKQLISPRFFVSCVKENPEEVFHLSQKIIHNFCHSAFVILSLIFSLFKVINMRI